jgi:hypothetical protein
MDFDTAYPATAVQVTQAGNFWPLHGYSYKNSYSTYADASKVPAWTNDDLKNDLIRNGLSTEYPEGVISFYSDRTWAMPGGVYFYNADGTLFVPKAGDMYKITYKYRAPLHNGNNMSINVVYGILDSFGNATTTGDKQYSKKTLANNTVEEAVTEWTEKSEIVLIPEQGEGYVPALGLHIGGTKKVAVYEEDGTTVKYYDYTIVQLDYVKVEKIPTTTVTYVALDGTEKTEKVAIGGEIKYHALKASRQNDVVWSLAKDSYVAAPKTATEAITVYEYASDVISFENYASVDYIKSTLNLQVSEDYAHTGYKSIKYENIGFSYTSAVPSDWAEKWTDYYKIVDGEFV